jgi:hypothetical protein
MFPVRVARTTNASTGFLAAGFARSSIFLATRMTLPARRSSLGITFVLLPLVIQIEFVFGMAQYGRCHGRKDFGCRR